MRAIIIKVREDGFLQITLPNGNITWATNLDDATRAIAEVCLLSQLIKAQEEGY